MGSNEREQKLRSTHWCVRIQRYAPGNSSTTFSIPPNHLHSAGGQKLRGIIAATKSESTPWPSDGSNTEQAGSRTRRQPRGVSNFNGDHVTKSILASVTSASRVPGAHILAPQLRSMHPICANYVCLWHAGSSNDVPRLRAIMIVIWRRGAAMIMTGSGPKVWQCSLLILQRLDDFGSSRVCTVILLHCPVTRCE